MAEFEAHNLAEDGDVLVIEGVSGMSNMGGISALTGKRAGERGSIVMGGIRDIPHSRSLGYPIWASEITPITVSAALRFLAPSVATIVSPRATHIAMTSRNGTLCRKE